MRKEIKDFLKSDKMVLYLPRDYSRDVMSQWTSVRNVLVAPINFYWQILQKSFRVRIGFLLFTDCFLG